MIDVQSLRDSFALIIEREPALTHRFYEVFFERYPQVKAMFHSSRQQQQERMLADALIAVLDHVDDAAWLTSVLKPLGAKHVGYGVRAEMYAWVGECLLAVLAEAAGPDWTKEVADNWTQAFLAIAGLMQEGAQSAERSSHASENAST